MNARKNNNAELALFIFPMVAIAAAVFGNWLFQWLVVVFPVAK